MRGLRRKPDYGEIDRLEHELGLDDETVLARRTKKRVLPKPVILSPRSAPLDMVDMRPGARWTVGDPSAISYVYGSAVFSSSNVHSPGMYAAVVPVSRVVLPPGVRKQVVVAVDWDGTLVDGDGRWLPGAVDALVRLVRGGDKVLIHSCRAGWAAGADEIRSRLAEVGLVGRVELVVGGKPAADAYVDDKAVRFTGDWPDTLWQLKHAA